MEEQLQPNQGSAVITVVNNCTVNGVTLTAGQEVDLLDEATDDRLRFEHVRAVMGAMRYGCELCQCLDAGDITIETSR